MIPLWVWSLWTSEPPLAVLASLPSILVSEPGMRTMLPSESGLRLPSILVSGLAMRPMLPSEWGSILPSVQASMRTSEPASVLAAARA